MSLVDKIETSKATVRQIAILASIPEGRIYKWTQGKSTPNGEDIKAVEGTLQLISKLSKEEIKKAANEIVNENKNLEQALKIATGNLSLSVEDLAEIKSEIPPHNQGEAAPPQESMPQTLEPDDTDPQSDNLKNDQTMFSKAMDFVERRMEKEDEKYNRILTAHEKLIDFIIKLNVPFPEGERAKKDPVHP